MSSLIKRIDDNLTIWVNTHDPSDSYESDADSVPTWRLYEEETGTPILTGSMSLLDDANTVGFYSDQIALTAANGFEAGKDYCVRILSTITGTAGENAIYLERFTIAPTLSVNVTQWLGTAPNALQSGRVDSRPGALAANVITASAIQDAALTAAKLATGAITSAKFAASAINAAAIATDAITATKIASNAITAAKLATDAITAAKLATDAVTEIRDAITGGAYALDTDANGRVRIVDGTAAGELDTSSGQVIVATNNDKTGYSISGTKTTLDALNDLDAAAVNAEVDTALADYDPPTKAELDTAESNIRGVDSDTLKSLSDQVDGLSTAAAPNLLQNTTIATLASQTSFTLTAGSADDDAYNGASIIVTDQSTSTQKAVGSISDYVGSTKTVTLDSDPGIFTMAVGDTVDILAGANASVSGTVDANLVSIDSDAQSMTDLKDFADAGYDPVTNKVEGVKLVDTTTVNTDMVTEPPTAVQNREEMDSNSTQLIAIKAETDKISAADAGAGVTGSLIEEIENRATPADIPTAVQNRQEMDSNSTQLAAIVEDTADMQPKLGTPAGADMSADIAALKAETALIVADTNELQTDLADGGRLDLLIDGIKAVTDAIPDGGALTALLADISAILTDTADMQPKLGTPAGASMSVDIAAIKTVVDGLSTLTASQVNAELVDVLNVDTWTELAAIPPAVTTLRQMIQIIYMFTTNKVTETSSLQTLRNRADDSDIGTATVSDDATTGTRGSFS